VADAALWAGVPADVTRLAPSGVHRLPAGGSVLVLRHDDDPVASWAPDLLVHPDPTRNLPWCPVVSFWLATADTIISRQVPAGHGHVYDSDFDQAWSRLLAVAGARS
jgi:uncharacterized membrane protein